MRPIGHSEDCFCETCIGDWEFVEVGRTPIPPRRGAGWHSDGGITVHMQMRWKGPVRSDAPYAFWLGAEGSNPLDSTRLWDKS
jgi:hypothetical protein